MLIATDFEVGQPVDKVWAFFDDIPQVAACLPGAELTDEVGPDAYKGKVAIRMGPVKLQFAGTATIKERDEEAKRLVVDAAGADEKGRGQAAMLLTAVLSPAGSGTKVEVTQDLQLSGAAAQYGRGMVADVTAVLMKDFSRNLQDRMTALQQGRSADEITSAAPASGFVRRSRRPAPGPGPGLPALLPALPTEPELRRRPMALWWIGNALLLLVVVPVLVALLNRVLAALERIRGASDDILTGGVALVGELDAVPDLLATTGGTIHAVSVGAVRYAGSVAQLLPPKED